LAEAGKRAAEAQLTATTERRSVRHHPQVLVRRSRRTSFRYRANWVGSPPELRA